MIVALDLGKQLALTEPKLRLLMTSYLGSPVILD